MRDLLAVKGTLYKVDTMVFNRLLMHVLISLMLFSEQTPLDDRIGPVL